MKYFCNVMTSNYLKRSFISVSETDVSSFRVGWSYYILKIMRTLNLKYLVEFPERSTCVRAFEFKPNDVIFENSL